MRATRLMTSTAGSVRMVTMGVASCLFQLRTADDLDVRKTALIAFFLICDNGDALQLFSQVQPEYVAPDFHPAPARYALLTDCSAFARAGST
jgi:hypothetical protein